MDKFPFDDDDKTRILKMIIIGMGKLKTHSPIS